jgi:4-amino-4-deoxy-L-arabinose transferase-like glycosyltransferase
MNRPLNIAVSSNGAERKILTWILLVAALLRLGAMAEFHSPLISDDKDYDAIARAVVHGEGYSFEGKPTAYRLPAYPLVLAAAYFFFGERHYPVKVLQMVFDLASCLLLFAIGKKLFSAKVGLLAAAILALFPIQILYVTHLMTETIFTTIFLLIFWLVVADEKGSYRIWNDLLLGALIGVGVLFRSPVGLVPLVILMYRWKAGRSGRHIVRSGAAMFFAMLLVLSPWLVRNYIEFQRITVTSNGGVNFWIGNHKNASGSYSFPDSNNPLAAIDDDFQRSDMGVKLGLEFIRSHPVDEVVIIGKKFAHFFAADYWLMMTMEFRPEWAHPIHAVTVFRQLSPLNALVLHLPYVVVLLLGTFAFVCNPPKDEDSVFLIRTLLLYWLAVHLTFFADARYRFPVVPLIILGAAYGWFLVREGKFVFTKTRALVLSLICLLYIGGWTGEIVTLSRQQTSLIPSMDEIGPKPDSTRPSLSAVRSNVPP